jgi:hypothetical protein
VDDGTPWLAQNYPATEAQSREILMTIHFLPPELDRYDVAVEDAIATCNGDLRGAVKALLILNEHLEAELMELQAALATGAIVVSRTDQSLRWAVKGEADQGPSVPPRRR